MSAGVDILLSTCNGEKYLSQQLESILKQDHTDWRLIIRDDGSTDSTVGIIDKFSGDNPNRVSIIKDNKGNIGYNASFMELYKCSTADYIMLCDQDDFWYPDKISSLLSALQKTERENKMALVFGDLDIADENLDITGDSFLRKMRYKSSEGQQVFFLANYVPGCNIMFNKALLKQVLATENIIGYHDQWIMMVAAAVGKVVCIEKPLMKYRIHDKNAIGMRGKAISDSGRFGLFLKDSLKYVTNNSGYRKAAYSKHMAQIQKIANACGDKLTEEANAFLAVDTSRYLSRKMKNISAPYLIGRSFLDQLTYIICF
jgi:glycosyltransferase involved in cell wall biosynthesis